MLSQSLLQLRAVILHPAPDRCVVDVEAARQGAASTFDQRIWFQSQGITEAPHVVFFKALHERKLRLFRVRHRGWGPSGIPQVDLPGHWPPIRGRSGTDRKSTRLNSSHLVISYAVFCLKKKKNA